MADAAISTVLKRLAPMIQKKVQEEVGLLLNADNEVQIISNKLEQIQQFLMDAERRGVTDPRVKSWLEKLQEIAYEIEYALDEWEVENLKQQFEESEDASQSSDLWEKVCSFLQSVGLCFKQTVQRRSIALDIKHINGRLDSIEEDNKKEFKFLPDLGRDSRDFKRDDSTSFVDVSKIQGREGDKNILMSKLLSDSSSEGEDNIQIISIVGAGGMGKTTLAQLVFNEVKDKAQFQVKSWVCVSDPFDEIKIAKAILEDLGNTSANVSRFENLLQRIAVSISGKRFLLFLDDVWTQDDEKWIQIRASLKSGAPGSKILVTTRRERVADIMGSTYNLSLGLLSDSYCWSILSQKAVFTRTTRDYEVLEKIGREIAKKCKGLPLAAMTLGGVLRYKSTPKQWQEVLNSEMWEIETVDKKLFPYLALSYNELHPAVKRCFSYCAIFPKDLEINVDELIRIWMAQGFLSSSRMERTGRSYFEDLEIRSFFQDFKKLGNRIISCKMHDIVHDFAQFLTKNESVIVERVNEGNEREESSQNVRHLNLLQNKDTTAMNLDSICQIEKLHSFFGRNGIPPNLFSHLKRVKSLKLHRCNLKSIPPELGKLIHMRYLGLSMNPIRALPKTLCDLYNLETLDISWCRYLSGLPEGIDKLMKLRHLPNESTSEFFKFPQGLEKLTNLRTLDQFIVGPGSNELGWLKDLNQLRPSLNLSISHLVWVDKLEADKVVLKSKKSIRALRLSFVRTESEIVEALQPHRDLESLHFEGHYFPKWMTTLTNLRRLRIFGSTAADEPGFSSLPPLGKLPFLEELHLMEMEMEYLDSEFLGVYKTARPQRSCETPVAFPKLKTLQFSTCRWWIEWEDISEEEIEIISILPCLQELHLKSCLKLKALPHRLLRKASSLKILNISDCTNLQNRYSPKEGEDWDKVSHITRVRFD